jgi:uncharacterized protein YdhG (YjbR/CyaY superfamily)
MANAASARVQAYIARQPPAARRLLKAVRSAVKRSAREASESFGYGIPGFKLHGRVLLYYAAWKQHMGLYPMGKAIREKHAAALRRFGTSQAGTIRFPYATPPTAALLTRLIKARIAEVRALATR